MKARHLIVTVVLFATMSGQQASAADTVSIASLMREVGVEIVGTTPMRSNCSCPDHQNSMRPYRRKFYSRSFARTLSESIRRSHSMHNSRN